MYASVCSKNNRLEEGVRMFVHANVYVVCLRTRQCWVCLPGEEGGGEKGDYSILCVAKFFSARLERAPKSNERWTWNSHTLYTMFWRRPVCSVFLSFSSPFFPLLTSFTSSASPSLCLPEYFSLSVSTVVSERQGFFLPFSNHKTAIDALWWIEWHILYSFFPFTLLTKELTDKTKKNKMYRSRWKVLIVYRKKKLYWVEKLD